MRTTRAFRGMSSKVRPVDALADSRPEEGRWHMTHQDPQYRPPSGPDHRPPSGPDHRQRPARTIDKRRAGTIGNRPGRGRPTPVRAVRWAGSAVRPGRSCAEATVTGSRQASARTRPYAVRSTQVSPSPFWAARAHTAGAGVTGPTAPRPTPAGLPPYGQSQPGSPRTRSLRPNTVKPSAAKPRSAGPQFRCGPVQVPARRRRGTPRPGTRSPKTVGPGPAKPRTGSPLHGQTQPGQTSPDKTSPAKLYGQTQPGHVPVNAQAGAGAGQHHQPNASRLRRPVALRWSGAGPPPGDLWPVPAGSVSADAPSGHRNIGVRRTWHPPSSRLSVSGAVKVIAALTLLAAIGVGIAAFLPWVVESGGVRGRPTASARYRRRRHPRPPGPTPIRRPGQCPHVGRGDRRGPLRTGERGDPQGIADASGVRVFALLGGLGIAAIGVIDVLDVKIADLVRRDRGGLCGPRSGWDRAGDSGDRASSNDAEQSVERR